MRCSDLPRPGGPPNRRRALALVAGAAACIALPALGAPRRAMRAMTEGPFYPPPRWRARWSDWDADLTRVMHRGETRIARGEHLGLDLAVVDADGRAVDRCDIEIWQCDVQQQYRHPSVPLDDVMPGREAGLRQDPGFQGFGSATGDARGAVSFRTIRPVPYPGRTPHIHVKLRHATFGELTSQLFVAGDPGNAEDGLWRRLPAADREGLEMRLVRAPAASPDGSGGPALTWHVRHELVVPA